MGVILKLRHGGHQKAALKINGNMGCGCSGNKKSFNILKRLGRFRKSYKQIRKITKNNYKVLRINKK